MPLGGITELRTHGVSGTPVESMLRHPHPVQVSGDALAGCYRRGDDVVPLGEPEIGPDRALEAYSWGRLTSGAAARAAWLTLLPFMLLNVAAWAHPPRPKPTYPLVALMSGALRVVGLLMTLVFVTVAAVVGLDVLAWQCAGSACGTEHFYTRWLTSGALAEPGRRIAVGALVPTLLVVVLWRLSRSSSKRYECYGKDTDTEDSSPTRSDGIDDPDERAQVSSGDMPLGAQDLGNRRFWQGGGPFTRLRSMHTGAALAVVAAIVGAGAQAGDTGSWSWLGRTIGWVGWGSAGVIAAVLASPWAGRRRELLGNKAPWEPARVAIVNAQWFGLLLLVVAVAYAGLLTDHPGLAEPAERLPVGPLPGLHRVVTYLLWAQALALVLLLVATALTVLGQERSVGHSFRGPILAGFAAPFLATLGLVLAAAYAAGLGFRVADLVGTPVPAAGAAYAGSTDIGLPREYYWAGFAAAVLAGLAVVVVGIAYLLLRRLRARARSAVDVDYPEAADDPDRADAIARAHASALMTEYGAPLLGSLVLGTIVITAATWLFYGTWSRDFVTGPTTVGTWLTGAFVLWLVSLGRGAYRNERQRRTIGILWDLGTFWPRAAHPFAPPCYCERTVPELATRVRRLRREGGRVVLSTHSQGTVIGTAVLLQLSDTAEGLALLTYGSPLQRLYARMFPHFFGLPMLRHVDAMLGQRWYNLYRRSDPIGGPVLVPDEEVGPTTAPDTRLIDPPFTMEVDEFSWPRQRGHSDYFHDPRFDVAVDTLASRLPPKS